MQENRNQDNYLLCILFYQMYDYIMNYRHLYHAGNFADVFKHCVLILLFQLLAKKDKPILYLDTHAGIGCYDLMANAAQKTREYETGIGRVYKLCAPSRVIQTYQKIVHECNNGETLRYYPGSPLLVRKLLRSQDRMILCELHSEDVKSLQHEFAKDKQVAVHHLDGYQSIKAFLPPKHGRGLIFIDPPFEQKNEFDTLLQALKVAYQRFPIGVYAIWYPIKPTLDVSSFYRELRQVGFKEVMHTQLAITQKAQDESLNQCGLALINPPWQFAEQLNSLLTWLQEVLVE